MSYYPYPNNMHRNSSYGVVSPASDKEKERNLQIFVGVMSLLLLGTLVFGAKGK